MAGEKVIATRGIDHAAARLGCRIERFLKRRSVIGLAVALRAKVTNGMKIGICLRADAPGRAEKQSASDCGADSGQPMALCSHFNRPYFSGRFSRRLAADILFKSIFTRSRS